jgi:1-aminocyclopropane-1-carboxylate deaminase
MDVKRSILQEITVESLSKRGISLFIKRDDLIDSEISGNKWRKLKYNIELCISKKKEGILTFGGAYSNHLVATAAACKLAKLKSIGMVRGEELSGESNATRLCTKRLVPIIPAIKLFPKVAPTIMEWWDVKKF